MLALFDLQSMSIQTLMIHSTLLILLILSITIETASAKCQNSSDFRYDLQQPVEIVNYNSICYEHSKRTCCSPSNLQTLAKKIGRVLGPSTELSLPCRKRLTSLMCSPCDGDIGENQYDGVCSTFCMSFYAECRDDLFAIDSNNQIRVCREDDIICSPLASIVAEKGVGFTCELFDLHLSNRNCWNGQISAKTRGKAPKKITINPKRPSTSSAKAAKSQPWLSDSTKTYLILVIILIFVLFYQYFSRRYRLWKRQIRNM